MAFLGCAACALACVCVLNSSWRVFASRPWVQVRLTDVEAVSVDSSDSELDDDFSDITPANGGDFEDVSTAQLCVCVCFVNGLAHWVV